MFPYILFVSLVSLAGGVLNVYRRFAVPAFTPVLLNLSIIGAAIFLARYFDPPIKALAWGVFIGGVAQLAFQIAPLARLGMLPRFALRLARPGRAPRAAAMGPALIGVSAAQISALINTQLASLLGDGRISWITYADRLMEFPSAMLGVALGTVLLPSLAKHYSDANHDEYSSLLDWGLRLAFLLALPAAVALWLLALPLITDALPVRQVHCERRVADAGGAAGLQRRPARADPREDPGARLLCAAEHQDAGAHRVLHRVRGADAGGDPDVAHWPRGAHARDEHRRLRERRRCCSGSCAANGSYRPQPGWLPFLCKLLVALGVLAAFALRSRGPAGILACGRVYGSGSGGWPASSRRASPSYFATLFLLGFRPGRLRPARALNNIATPKCDTPEGRRSSFTSPVKQAPN